MALKQDPEFLQKLKEKQEKKEAFIIKTTRRDEDEEPIKTPRNAKEIEKLDFGEKLFWKERMEILKEKQKAVDKQK